MLSVRPSLLTVSSLSAFRYALRFLKHFLALLKINAKVKSVFDPPSQKLDILLSILLYFKLSKLKEKEYNQLPSNGVRQINIKGSFAPENVG